MTWATSNARPSAPPSRVSAGTTTSRCRSWELVARIPSESHVSSTTMPAVPAGIRNCETTESSAADRAATRYASAWPAPDTNDFEPLMWNPPSTAS